MPRRHTVSINVADKESGKRQILRGREMSLPKRLLRFIFGEWNDIMVFTPADSVTSIEIKEVAGGGA